MKLNLIGLKKKLYTCNQIVIKQCILSINQASINYSGSTTCKTICKLYQIQQSLSTSLNLVLYPLNSCLSNVY
jgi:hypothetical protein